MLQSQFGFEESCPAVIPSEVRVPANINYGLQLPVTNFPTNVSLFFTCIDKTFSTYN